MTLSVASVTTAYNAEKVLPRHIDALLKQSRALDEIVVVDNGSADGTADLLARRYPQVTVLRMADNLGAAGAWSAGLAYAALQKKYDWVWTFDDDSVPRVDTLEILLRAIANMPEAASSLGMVAPIPVHRATQTYYPPLLWSEGFVKLSASLMKEAVWLADLVIASGCMVRGEVVGAVGLPRTDFFMDFFDFEYCLRVRARGYKIAVIRAAESDHEIGHARDVRLPWYSGVWPNHAPWREYYISRNLEYATWWLYPSRGAKRFTIRHLARHAGGVLLFGSNKMASLRKMALGFYDGTHARLGVRFRPS